MQNPDESYLEGTSIYEQYIGGNILNNGPQTHYAN